MIITFRIVRALLLMALAVALAWLALGALQGSEQQIVVGAISAYLAGLFCAIFTILARDDAARVRALRAGDGVLARWTVDAQEWQDHAIGEWQFNQILARRRIWTWGVYGAIVFAAFSALSSITGSRVFESSIIQLALPAFGFIVGGLVALFVNGIILLWAWLFYRPRLLPPRRGDGTFRRRSPLISWLFRQPRRGDVEVIVGRFGAVYAGTYVDWTRSKFIKTVSFEPGKNAVIEVVIGTRRSNGQRINQGPFTTIRLPVPRGREAEAKAIAQRLQGD